MRMTKTKREQRQEAIERLQKLLTGECGYGDVMRAVLGDDAFIYNSSRQDALSLIDLLTDDDRLAEDDCLALLRDAVVDYVRIQTYYKGLLKECNRLCDDTYMQLPRDVNGEVIHLYDELAGYGYPNGGVVCKAIVNDQVILVGRITDTYREWLLWDAYKCHHYKRPTMKDVLWDFLHAADDAMRRGYDEPPSEVFDEFIAKLKEVDG